MYIKLAQLSIIVLVAFFVTLTGSSDLVSAHRDGCHSHHSCPSDSGSYVCGDTGNYSECGSPTPATFAPQQATTVRTPVKTSTEEFKDSVIKYKTVKKNNSNQYIGYKKIITKGVVGIGIAKVVVQLTDGIETSRSTPTSITKQEPVTEVIEVGVREKPTARFTKIREMTGGFMNFNKGKYIVEGFYTANQNVVLYQNGKKAGTTKTDKNGYFEFKKLNKASVPSWLILYDKNGDKGKKLSEKTKTTFTTKELKTEYASLHEK